MFNVRDLMINLAARFPAARADLNIGECYDSGCDVNGSIRCWASCFGCSLTCPNSGWPVGCGGSFPKTQVMIPADAALVKQYHDAAKRQLATLKEQLREALAEVEEQERVLGESDRK
jgi:hypothetical protein